jgi:hypothetical protein
MAPAVPPGTAPAQRTARQRRPTGAPPPLPHPFRVTTTAWLLLFVGSLFFLVIVGQWIYYGLSRPRPYGVSIIDSWGGYSAPSPPVVVLTIFLMGAVYCLVVPGRPRAYAKAAVAVVLTVFCLDYALRLLQDIGVRTARPYGIVEITPEREYMLVTEYFVGAVEIGEADVDDGLIDQGLTLIRRLWDGGVAHRDIKPGNLMVRPGELLLIDVAFVQVRPSPWRQAVDLGNMMLVLAVRTDPERVYRRALSYFTPAELSEAFAATRGVASPTQLRAFMKRDPRDLLGTFRALAPPRKPIVLQRWSIRRVGPGGRFASLRIYTFPGGCVSYQLDFAPGASPLLATGVRSAVAFMPRVTLVDYVRDKEGLALCGRGAACPG